MMEVINCWLPSTLSTLKTLLIIRTSSVGLERMHEELMSRRTLPDPVFEEGQIEGTRHRSQLHVHDSQVVAKLQQVKTGTRTDQINKLEQIR